LTVLLNYVKEFLPPWFFRNSQFSQNLSIRFMQNFIHIQATTSSRYSEKIMKVCLSRFWEIPKFLKILKILKLDYVFHMKILWSNFCTELRQTAYIFMTISNNLIPYRFFMSKTRKSKCRKTVSLCLNINSYFTLIRTASLSTKHCSTLSRDTVWR
jgi:hypothetical protein